MNLGRYDAAQTNLETAQKAGVANADANLKILERLRRLQQQNK